MPFLSEKTATAPSPVSEPTAPASHKEIEEIKNLIAQQTKIIADQASQMQKLTSEVEALKSKLN